VTRVKPWKELGRRRLLDCRVFEVESSLAQSPVDGSTHEYFRIICPDWVQIVPVTADDEVVMVRQYRHGSAALSLEVPAGLIEAGEMPAEAALRECLEETGFRAATAEPLGIVNPNPAYFANRLHMFYGPGAEPTAPIANTATEQTEVELVRLDDVARLLLEGTIDHALDVALLWRFLREVDK
jgi:ADP-ribose pyrophosphatase